jgi:23S rRNA-/tRNA-specific pseudouridylate synthase
MVGRGTEDFSQQTKAREESPHGPARRCTARHLRNSHTHWPRTAPTHWFRVGREPKWQTVKSLAKVISRAASTTTFEVSLNSGRPHQIRIHLASIGHPLVGDPLYGLSGRPRENLPGLPGDGGYFLHAQFLNFPHPITGEQINLEAALPEGFSLQQ